MALQHHHLLHCRGHLEIREHFIGKYIDIDIVIIKKIAKKNNTINIARKFNNIVRKRSKEGRRRRKSSRRKSS